MEEHVGGTQLIEYIEEANDGSYCKLMGWPSQTDLSVKTSHPSGASLESWYPNTAPTAPSGLQWMPYKIVKTVPHDSRLDQIHPLRGALRYHKDMGWHFRYSVPFKIIGRPPLPSSMKSKNPDKSIPSMSMAQLCLWPQPKIKKQAFIRLKRNKVKVKEIAEVRLKRIEQQPGFRSLKILMEPLN